MKGKSEGNFKIKLEAHYINADRGTQLGLNLMNGFGGGEPPLVDIVLEVCLQHFETSEGKNDFGREVSQLYIILRIHKVLRGRIASQQSQKVLAPETRGQLRGYHRVVADRDEAESLAFKGDLGVLLDKTHILIRLINFNP